MRAPHALVFVWNSHKISILQIYRIFVYSMYLCFIHKHFSLLPKNHFLPLSSVPLSTNVPDEVFTIITSVNLYNELEVGTILISFYTLNKISGSEEGDLLQPTVSQLVPGGAGMPVPESTSSASGKPAIVSAWKGKQYPLDLWKH